MGTLLLRVDSHHCPPLLCQPLVRSRHCSDAFTNKLGSSINCVESPVRVGADGVGGGGQKAKFVC